MAERFPITTTAGPRGGRRVAAGSPGHALRSRCGLQIDQRPARRTRLPTLTGISTKALKGDDATYTSLTAQIKSITSKRNDIAGQMISMLEDATFKNRPINEAVAASLIKQAKDLIASLP